MEFKSLKNIETSFRQIRLFSMVFLALCAVVTVWSVWSSYRFAEFLSPGKRGNRRGLSGRRSMCWTTGSR